RVRSGGKPADVRLLSVPITEGAPGVDPETPRPGFHQLMMRTARLWAERSTCSRLQVGAVLAREDRIIAVGYNGAVSGQPHCVHEDDSPCEVSVHAEENVLYFAAK